MNNFYKVSFKDDLGRIHTVRLELGPHAQEPLSADAEPLVSEYLSTYGRALSGCVTVKREKGPKR